MWRIVILMAGYAPWIFLYFPLAFSIMYSPPWLQLPVLVGYVALYGVLSYRWLSGSRMIARVLCAFAIPLPVLAVIALSEYHSLGNVGFILRWLVMLVIHAGGVLTAALLSRLSARTRYRF
ncbi:MAG: hypothetical protein P8011_03300 [Acidihalobacter sp.]|jgi:hypothetical protein|uniref:hypothetical protein n=1 Tax=Acidihalobacter sp. TaxID=1872108 RepID=UPI00307D97B7